MAGRGHIIPLNVSNNTNNLTNNCTSQSACDKGNLIVHEGSIKDEDAIVKRGSSGWNENYFYDNRGKDYSPPGFPTTTEGTEGAAAQPGDPLDAINSPIATGWTSAIGKTLPDGTQDRNSDFSLNNEIRQGTLQ